MVVVAVVAVEWSAFLNFLAAESTTTLEVVVLTPMSEEEGDEDGEDEDEDVVDDCCLLLDPVDELMPLKIILLFLSLSLSILNNTLGMMLHTTRLPGSILTLGEWIATRN